MVHARPKRKPLDLATVAALLGQSSRQVGRALKRGRFPAPSVDRDGHECWEPDEVWRWAAEFQPAAAAAMPLKYWPTRGEPAVYDGAREISGGVVQDWYVDDVPLRVLWPLPEQPEPSPAEAAALYPQVPQVLRITAGVGLYGPEMEAVSQHGNDGYINWIDYAHTLGGRAPHWPYALRTTELITSWQPGVPPEVALAVPVLDTAPLLRLAVLLVDGCPAQRTLIHLARTLQSKANGRAELEIGIFAEHERFSTVDVAAVPVPAPRVDEDDLDESIRRAGWLAILARPDTLAVAVVRAVLAWDGGSTLPFSQCEEIYPERSRYGAEWAARLVSVGQPTAAFEIPNRRVGSAVEYLLDPETDAPVIRTTKGTLLAAIPQALPAQSPLAEVVLDKPIWVRTQDGTLFPAPLHNYFGLNWGYGGSGPGSLALLLHRLLDDINARAADDINGASEGLEEFTQQDWPHGSVFTREQLLAARDGRPYSED